MVDGVEEVFEMGQLVAYMVVILAVAAAGAVLPFVRRWRTAVLHLFIAFGAGVFLGAVFFHLLPDVQASKDAFVFVLGGFLIVLLFEQLTTSRHDEDCGPGCPHRHDVVGAAAFVGLVIHSLTAGFALGAGTLADPKLGFVVFFAIIAHKAVAAFSLSTVLRLSTFSVRRSAVLLGAFVFTTPLGALFAYALISDLSPRATQVSTALAAGTFLYVATMDLLPEAFHERGHRSAAGLSMLIGLAVMLLISFAGA